MVPVLKGFSRYCGKMIMPAPCLVFAKKKKVSEVTLKFNYGLSSKRCLPSLSEDSACDINADYIIMLHFVVRQMTCFKIRKVRSEGQVLMLTFLLCHIN